MASLKDFCENKIASHNAGNIVSNEMISQQTDSTEPITRQVPRAPCLLRETVPREINEVLVFKTQAI